jgi:hypothetical protein
MHPFLCRLGADTYSFRVAAKSTRTSGPQFACQRGEKVHRIEAVVTAVGWKRRALTGRVGPAWCSSARASWTKRVRSMTAWSILMSERRPRCGEPFRSRDYLLVAIPYHRGAAGPMRECRPRNARYVIGYADALFRERQYDNAKRVPKNVARIRRTPVLQVENLDRCLGFRTRRPVARRVSPSNILSTIFARLLEGRSARIIITMGMSG